MSERIELKSFFTRNKCNDVFVKLTLIFSLSCIILWAFHELSQLGTDFGAYYTSARYLDKNYTLYNQIFDHKGPTYFYF